MGNTTDPETENLQTRGKRYLLFSYVSLVLLAITWSLGAAFVYIFLALAIFLGFLAISRFVQAYSTERNSYRGAYGEKSGLSEWWYQMVNKQRAPFTSSRGQQAPAPATGTTPVNAKKIVKVAVFIAGSFFFTMILVAIFSDGSDEVIYLAAADAYTMEGKTDSAKIYYKAALHENENSLAGSTALGKIMNQGQQYDSALFYFEKSIEIDPESGDGYYGKAQTYYYQERYEDAISVLKTLIEENENYGPAYTLAGDSYYLQKQYPEALPYYEKAYERGERSKELVNIMAYIYDVQGKYDKAITFYTETLQYGDDAEISARITELQAPKQ
jgi:tetratricopeptide (TPR) repeat protein